MQLSFKPTKLGGGVRISTDLETRSQIERLLTKTSIYSDCCSDSGSCMLLSRYFEKRNDVVDWVTLVCGVVILRKSLGYVLTKRVRALLALLEYETFNALLVFLGSENEESIEMSLKELSLLDDLKCSYDQEKAMVALYLSKTRSARKANLLPFLSTLHSFQKAEGKRIKQEIAGYSHAMLIYSAGSEFEFPL